MSSTDACFNKECREAKSERRRKGWRLRNGEHAELCDRCGSAYEEGKFCDTFHPHVAGWRSCESCGKPVHCGCIVSAHTFVLLDAGGVSCIDCSRKTSILIQNPACSSPPGSFMSFNDLLKLNQSLNDGNGSVGPPGSFMSFNDLLKLNQSLNAGNGSVGFLSQAAHLTCSAQTVLQSPRPCLGLIHEEKHSLCMRSGLPVIVKDQSPVSHYGLASASCSETENQTRASIITQQLSTPLTGNPLSPTSNNGLDSLGKTHRNAKVRADINNQNQVFSWYGPKISDKELQKISGDSNFAIMPLFEKMLSVSDAGRVGRLVLPKKCAETYFPPISEPEGLPLKIQDVKGQEWTFQFRFWPNNNSRMYVLEGITPCIQSMELQAGDTVTFSRLEPKGKLIMGYRKAASIPTCSQVDKVDPVGFQSKVDKSGNEVKEAPGSKTSLSKRRNGIVGSTIKRMKLDTLSLIELKVTMKEAQGLLRPHIDHTPKVVLVEDFEFEEYEDAPVIGRPTIITKASVGHCNEDVQWAQCDSCCKWRRIPPYILPPSRWTCSDNSWDPERSSCIDAQELSNRQLEDLLNTMRSANCKKHKAIKLNSDPGEPSNDPPAATMSKSSIRPSMPKEEVSIEQLEHLLYDINSANSRKSKGAELDSASADCSDGLHSFTGETASTLAQATTSKHPRHRPGCSCIVCIQPSSGKGPKHVSTCTCNVCTTVRRRFQTMMMRREKKKSEKEPETVLQPDPKINSSRSSDKVEEPSDMVCSNPELSTDKAPSKKPSTSSPAKGHFDLNIQPEREEEMSSHSNPGNMIDKFDDAVEETSKELNEGVNVEQSKMSKPVFDCTSF